MYVESGYLIKSNDEEEIVFIEIKKDGKSIAHSFYEINHNFKAKTLDCREIKNPIAYMQEHQHIKYNRIDDLSELNSYVDYLYEAGKIKSENEYKVYKARSYLLKNERYGTSKEEVFKKKK